MNVNEFYKAHAASIGITTPVSNWNEYSDAIVTSGAKKGVAVASLVNSTGVVGNNAVENVPAATAASTDTSAASLTSTNASITALENNIADLTDKLNALLTALRNANIIAP